MNSVVPQQVIAARCSLSFTGVYKSLPFSSFHLKPANPYMNCRGHAC